jgi:uncharacterized protein (TIGR01777 family)
MGTIVRVGVTGSSGFIGSAVVAALHERGDDVISFVRPSGHSTAETTVRWDPSRQLVDDGDLRRVGGFDAVVHLAGAGIADKRWTPARKQEILLSRTGSTSLLVSALESMSSGTAVLASGSAIGYYGPRGDEVLDESSVRGADFLSDVCVGWENAALALNERGSIVTLLRTGIVMSQHGGALKRQLPLFRLGLGGQLSTGQQWLSPISLRDEVRAILWVIDHKIAGPVNLVSPEPLRNSEFTKALAHGLHRPAFARVPAIALQLVLGGELASSAVLASQRVLPKVLADTGFSFDNPTPDSIISSSIRS